MTEKIQFFMSDLAYKLQVGEIKEIHIAEQNGQKVLRMECEKMEPGEYKTVRASRSTKPKSAPKREPATTKRWPEKLAASAKEFLFNPARNKNKPFGDGRRFG